MKCDLTYFLTLWKTQSGPCECHLGLSEGFLDPHIEGFLVLRMTEIKTESLGCKVVHVSKSKLIKYMVPAHFSWNQDMENVDFNQKNSIHTS